MTNVFLLSRWATCADYVEVGPLAFATFGAARAHARDADQTCPDWWFQHRHGRALRWREPKRHDAGFWEILTCPVEEAS